MRVDIRVRIRRRIPMRKARIAAGFPKGCLGTSCLTSCCVGHHPIRRLRRYRGEGELPWGALR